jgi:hypothetical protein
MKANELRLGNLVTHNGVSMQVTKIEASNEDNPILCLQKGEGYSDFYRMSYENDGVLKPIPVTTGILEKAGFKNCILVEKIKYVHQLQNLYFALIGEELVIDKC